MRPSAIAGDAHRALGSGGRAPHASGLPLSRPADIRGGGTCFEAFRVHPRSAAAARWSSRWRSEWSCRWLGRARLGRPPVRSFRRRSSPRSRTVVRSTSRERAASARPVMRPGWVFVEVMTGSRRSPRPPTGSTSTSSSLTSRATRPATRHLATEIASTSRSPATAESRGELLTWSPIPWAGSTTPGRWIVWSRSTLPQAPCTSASSSTASRACRPTWPWPSRWTSARRSPPRR